MSSVMNEVVEAADVPLLRRGFRFEARRWLPQTAVRAVVVIVHGWGSHVGKYADVAQWLNLSGYAVMGFDFEGHGRSPGVRAQVNSFEALVEDLQAYLQRVHAEFKETPVYLCGHSMGGTIVATYLALYPHRVAGAIFHASGLVVSPHIPAIKILLAPMIGRLMPRLPMLKLTSGKVMSRDPVEIARFDNDPLTYQGKMTAGTGKTLLLANQQVTGLLEKIEVPFLVLQGTADPVVAPEGAALLYTCSPSSDKTLREYPDALHDLFHESNRMEVLNDLLDWLNHRTSPRGAQA